MNEIYNRTLLYENDDTKSAVNLSEAVTNFEFCGAQLNNNAICYFPGKHIPYLKFDIVRYNDNNEAIMHEPKLVTMTNSDTTLSCINYQTLVQSGTTGIALLGSGYNNNNYNIFNRVWGFNRISGTETSSIGSELIGSGWKKHNETLIASGNTIDGNYRTNPKYFNLLEPASSFERIRLQVGSNNESLNLYEYSSPSADNQTFGVHSLWGNNSTANGVSIGRYIWLNGTKTLSAYNGGQGKTYSLGSTAQNPLTSFNGARMTANSTDNSNIYITRPIQAIWGINKKV